jgi:two-component system NtrC family sensor kinase
MRIINILHKQFLLVIFIAYSFITKKINSSSDSYRTDIKVADNNNGIPQNIVDKIFQPFFTTKPTGEGTGLGLSLAYDIITKEHDGTLKVESKEGEGSAFIIQLLIS